MQNQQPHFYDECGGKKFISSSMYGKDAAGSAVFILIQAAPAARRFALRNRQTFFKICGADGGADLPHNEKALTIARKGLISLASPRGFEPLSTA